MKTSLTVLFALSLQLALAQKGFFTRVEAGDKSAARVEKYISRFSLFRIHTENLKDYLKKAPLEFNEKHTPGVALEVPLPDGTTEVFDILESPFLAPAVARKHPEIRSYTGKGRQHPHFTIRINFTTSGFSAIVLGAGSDAAYFEKLNDGGPDNTYKCYFARDAVSPENHKRKHAGNRCGALDSERAHLHGLPEKNGRAAAMIPTGATLRTFNLAMAATGEFTAQKGGTQLSAFNALTNYVNNLNAVYRQELSVAFTLVSDETLVYTDAATDPYNNDDQEAMLDENQAHLDAVLGNPNYDIGHVLGYMGGSGGGIAMRPSVCASESKGQGVSGVGDGSYAEVFDFQLVAHEIGHQFGMSHTYNSNVPVCTTRTFGTSVEPGAGTTIMSYGFTCSNSDAASGLTGNDDYETPYAPFLNFHAVSLEQANSYIATLSCFTTTNTGNAVPAVTPMPTLYVIPKSTPFVLEAQATDNDASDILSYSWEGTNISDEPEKSQLTATTISDDTRPPFFRSYLPVQAGESSTPGRRYYPRLQAILDGSNYAKGDKLPSVGITTTHTLTVRDNRGGVTSENVTVEIDGNSGPFLVTNDPAGTHQGKSGLTVEWSVNGTANAPVNCTLVDISLSTDGGKTFPTLLAGSVPNTGTAVVTLPDINATEARIRIAPAASTDAGNSPNIFFDISNQDFAIEKAPMPVRLIVFEVSLEEAGSALLTWKTSEEVNNAGFEVEMSPDSRDFQKIGFVKGSGRNAVNPYSFTVGDLLEGTYYFRLKQLDTDGKYEYSPIRVLKVAGTEPTRTASVFPNPAGDKIRIKNSASGTADPVMRIFNLKGELVLIPSGTRSENHLEADISRLPPGIYILTLTTGEDSKGLKFIKL